jgi:hypothetical protein
MDEAMIYNSVPRVVWVMFAWSLVGAGIALATLHTVNLSRWAWKKWCVPAEPQHDLLDRWWEREDVSYTYDFTNTQGETVAAPRKRKGKKTARKPRKSKSVA